MPQCNIYCNSLFCYACVTTHTHARTHTCTCTHTCTHTCMHAHTHAPAHTHTHHAHTITRMHTHTCLHTHAHVHTHTHYATEERLEFVKIGSVNRDHNFTYLPGEKENSWPGRLWQMEKAVAIVCHVHGNLFGNIHSFFSTLLSSRRCNSIWWCSQKWNCVSTSFPHCHLLHPGYCRHRLCCGMPRIQLHLQKQEVGSHYKHLSSVIMIMKGGYIIGN